MINEDKVHGIVNLVKTLGYDCCVAGSSVYLDEGTSSDIDVYVDFSDKDVNLYKIDFLDQMTMEGEFKILEKEKSGNSKAYSDSCDWIFVCDNLRHEDGTVYNVIGTTHKHPEEIYAHSVISFFDYGVTQVAWNGDTVVVTEEYMKDKKNRTLTLYNVWSYYHLNIMGERIKKMQDRFPGYRIVFSNGFYKGSHSVARKRKTQMNKQSLTSYFPERFIDQVRLARERLRNWRLAT